MLEDYKPPIFNAETALTKSRETLEVFKDRRTVREFEIGEIDQEIVTNAIKVAGLAPSGANKQPWSFVLVKDRKVKREIREKAEAKEYDFYHTSPYKKWRQDLKPLHTNENKSFITDASYLIIIYLKPYDIIEGETHTNYYASESVGIATGFLISTLHQCGLSVLTYTPSKMDFLKKMFGRQKQERPYMLLAVGKAKKGCKVPVIEKKSIDEILQIF